MHIIMIFNRNVIYLKPLKRISACSFTNPIHFYKYFSTINYTIRETHFLYSCVHFMNVLLLPFFYFCSSCKCSVYSFMCLTIWKHACMSANVLQWSILSLLTTSASPVVRQAGSPTLAEQQCKTLLFQFSPQTHHPEKPLFPTTGSPREHYS